MIKNKTESAHYIWDEHLKLMDHYDEYKIPHRTNQNIVDSYGTMEFVFTDDLTQHDKIFK